MALSLPIFRNPAQALHEPGGEVWVGVRTPGTELPERAARIEAALVAAGGVPTDPPPCDETAVLAVHDRELVDYLEGAWDAWVAAGLTQNPGADRIVPYLFAHPGLLGELPARRPGSAAALAGAFAYDTMTLVGPGTWEAARRAVDAAVAAADCVAAGERLAYALCRPPGHHATRMAYGGSCYLNNAAAAAARLRDETGYPVAVLDIDAHHGNGTQAIFYADPAVLTGSVHVDPGAGWFPHHVGFANEHGSGAGTGANLNLPLAPGTRDGPWLESVARLGSWARESGARALVVALGVDAAAADPESPLDVTVDAFYRAGAELAETGLPVVAVQEGGYDLEALGELVVATLEGFAAG